MFALHCIVSSTEVQHHQLFASENAKLMICICLPVLVEQNLTWIIPESELTHNFCSIRFHSNRCVSVEYFTKHWQGREDQTWGTEFPWDDKISIMLENAICLNFTTLFAEYYLWQKERLWLFLHRIRTFLNFQDPLMLICIKEGFMWM